MWLATRLGTRNYRAGPSRSGKLKSHGVYRKLFA